MLECFMIKSHLNIYGTMIWEEKKGGDGDVCN